MDIWDKLYSKAKQVQHGREISPYIEAGGVAAALLTKAGNIYTGVCIDTACSLGMCAERNAMAAMITGGEHEIDKLIALMPDCAAGPPCGACMEAMMQLSPKSGQIQIMLDYPERKIVTLKELFPLWWGQLN